MKDNARNRKPNLKSTATPKRTYKPRTPITKTTIKIMNDPFIFTV